MENNDLLSYSSDNAKNIGNKLEDFTILQVLGEGSFGFVAKVQSKINLKIYALKKILLKIWMKKKEKNLKMKFYF